ncbi:hypothetical protein Tco_1124437 [Tanacetum coccineum]|uniref:Uncharacterized protein n=1 Tax=Tanacetum coccineum TaxID=301880 RepID=A0ABQ5J648_9ASTR
MFSILPYGVEIEPWVCKWQITCQGEEGWCSGDSCSKGASCFKSGAGRSDEGSEVDSVPVDALLIVYSRVSLVALSSRVPIARVKQLQSAKTV